jgi:hypothetical protein
MYDETPPSMLRQLGRGALAATTSALRLLGPALAALWRLVKPVLLRALEFLLALVIVFEEWGWRPLADLLGRLARWRPWAAVESLIMRLPPYAALVVFVLPSTLLLPLKLLAVVLIAKGQIILAGILFALAKVVATALVARLFMLTQPALMQIGWFAWGYETLMPWKDALVARVHASWAWRMARVWRERAKRIVSARSRRWQPTFTRLRAAMRAATERMRSTTRRLLRQIRDRWATPQR